MVIFDLSKNKIHVIPNLYRSVKIPYADIKYLEDLIYDNHYITDLPDLHLDRRDLYFINEMGNALISSYSSYFGCVFDGHEPTFLYLKQFFRSYFFTMHKFYRGNNRKKKISINLLRNYMEKSSGDFIAYNDARMKLCSLDIHKTTLRDAFIFLGLHVFEKQNYQG